MFLAILVWYISHVIWQTALTKCCMQVLAGRDGAFVKCLLPGVDDITTTAAYERGIIATQVTDTPIS